MLRRKERTKMDILGNIPEEFIKVLFRISLILVSLNVISLIMTLIYNTDTTIALLSTIISGVVTTGCFVVIKKKNRKASMK